MKRILLVFFALISIAAFSQEKLPVNSETLSRLDTISDSSNYIVTKYRASVLLAPLIGPTFTDTVTIYGRSITNDTTTEISGGHIGSYTELIINPASTSSGDYYANWNIADYQANFPTTSGHFTIGSWGEGRNSGISTLENVVGAWYRANNISAGRVQDHYGMVGQARNSGTGAVTRGFGVVGAMRNQLTGTVDTAVGVWGDIINADAGGYIRHASNLRASTPYSNAGTIDTLVGLYIDPQSPPGGGTINEKWAIYQAGSGDRSYFAGDILFDGEVEQEVMKLTATDTTGIGSTANIGTMMYFDGHFYGLIAGTPPTWAQLDN